jgi:hypothetical protein
MDINSINKNAITKNSLGPGPVTPENLRARAQEVALMAGRKTAHVSQADYEQAWRELTGAPEIDRLEAVLESMPEEMRWNPVPGSEGHQARESPTEEEDEDGRSETEQLVEEGVEEAERDQVLQAARAAEKNDGRNP